MNAELMFLAKEFLNGEKWRNALANGNDFLSMQTAIAEFAGEVLRVERARVAAKEPASE